MRRAGPLLTAWLWLLPASLSASELAAGHQQVLAVILQPADVGRDGYLEAAASYFRGLGMPVRTAHSLTELHNELVQRVEAHGPLGEVILVAHGSTWTGAAVDLFPGGPAASVSAMQQARADGSFPALPPGSLAADTRIRLDSCAVGRHQAWVRAFAQLWSAAGEPSPLVEASAEFIAFGSTVTAGGIVAERIELPISVQVQANAPDFGDARTLTLAGEACGQIASPCQQRQLPIKVTVQLDQTVADKAYPRRRRLAQRAARAQLMDLNLRADQLDWSWKADADGGGQRWLGTATALITSPLPPR